MFTCSACLYVCLQSCCAYHLQRLFARVLAMLVYGSLVATDCMCMCQSWVRILTCHAVHHRVAKLSACSSCSTVQLRVAKLDPYPHLQYSASACSKAEAYSHLQRSHNLHVHWLCSQVQPSFLHYFGMYSGILLLRLSSAPYHQHILFCSNYHFVHA